MEMWEQLTKISELTIDLATTAPIALRRPPWTTQCHLEHSSQRRDHEEIGLLWVLSPWQKQKPFQNGNFCCMCSLGRVLLLSFRFQTWRFAEITIALSFLSFYSGQCLHVILWSHSIVNKQPCTVEAFWN